MSMIFSAPGLMVCASDTRWTWRSSIGSREVDRWFDDHGAKVRRVPGGWVCATGEARLCALGLRKLESHGVDGAQAAFDEALAETLAQHALVGRTEVDLTHFLIGSDSGAIEVLSTNPGDSCRLDPQPGKVLARASWAAGLTPEQEQAVQRAFVERVNRQVSTAMGVVHAIATAFIEARGFDSVSMSDELEIGVSGAVFGHLRGRAEDVATSCLRSSGRGDVVFGPPPSLPPFPLPLFERTLFAPFEEVAL